MKHVLFTLGLALFSLNAHADEATPKSLLACWDETYAYGRINVTEVQGQDDLLQVEMESEQQAFLKDLATRPPAFWGQGKVSFYVPKTACKRSDPASLIFDCSTAQSMLSVEYDESEEAHLQLNIVASEIHFTTAMNGVELVATISMKRAGSSAVQSAVLNFPRLNGQSCSVQSL